MKRKEKKKILVSALKAKIEQATTLIVINYSSLNANKVNNLRFELSKVNAYLKVVKNSLLKLAIKNTHAEIIDSYCVGSIALGISNDDPIGVSKIITEFSKSNKEVTVLSGSVDGKLVSPSEIKMLGNTPPLPVMRVQIARALLMPATLIARCMQKPMIDLACAMKKKN